MSYYRRNLPHWIPAGKSIFLTWRLAGSLPVPSRRRTAAEEDDLTPGEKFIRLDRSLDAATRGPLWLKDPRIAELVVAAILKGESELRQYVLRAFIVMPNHVHLLVTPKAELRQITSGLKGATAKTSNKILNRTGEPFWQDESFDHWLRRNEAFTRIISYIERNPVSAGLVKRPEDWPWSSASLKPKQATA
jgi:putative transposase